MPLTVSNRSEGDVRIVKLFAEHQDLVQSVNLPDLFGSPPDDKVIISLADLEGLQAPFTTAILQKFQQTRNTNTNFVLAAPADQYYEQLKRMGLPLRLPVFAKETEALAAFANEGFKPTDSWQARNDYLVQAGAQTYNPCVQQYNIAASISPRPVGANPARSTL